MISIKIDESGTSTVSMVRGGQTHNRAVSFSEVLGLLGEATSFDTGLLPPGTRYFWHKGNKAVLVVEVPSHRRTLLVKHDYSSITHTIENVPLPNTIFIFKIVKSIGTYSISQIQLHAGKRGIELDAETPLFEYPTPNVEGGRICWGYDGKVLNGLKHLSGIEGAVRAFYRTNFNDHIWYKDSLSKEFPFIKEFSWKKIEKYFNILAEQPCFSNDWLAPSRAHHTLGDAISAYKSF